MSKHEITNFFSNSGSRNEVRMRVVNALASEEPGIGRGEDASKYIYFVETLRSGDRIYLQRPAIFTTALIFLCVLKMLTMLCQDSQAGTFQSMRI